MLFTWTYSSELLDWHSGIRDCPSASEVTLKDMLVGPYAWIYL